MLKKIKTWWILYREGRKLMKEVKGIKAGWKTTEFWLGLAGILATIWFGVEGLIPAELMAKIIAIVIVAYEIARAIVKFTPTQKDDEILEKIEELFRR